MKTRSFVGEFNRCRGDNIRRCAHRFERRGITATVVPHKTTLKLELPDDMDWLTFKQSVYSELTPRIGSVVLHSARTGNTYVCRTGGNRPGKFMKI